MANQTSTSVAATRAITSKSADSKTAYSFEAAVSILPIRLERFSLEHGPSCLRLGEPEKIDPSPARHSFGTGRCPNPLFHISLPACRAECPELWPAPHSHRPVLIVRLSQCDGAGRGGTSIEGNTLLH